MRIRISPLGVSLWLSKQETTDWANGAIWAGTKQGWITHGSWPYSQLRGKRVFASFDRNGLCDMTIDGNSSVDCDASEFSALCADYLSLKLPKEHPCYDVACGQFQIIKAYD